MMNFEQARFNMIEQQVRPWDVLNPDVLAAMTQVPREDFVLPEYRKLAFADTYLAIGHGQCMLTPREEGRILQALNLKHTDRVLEIGTGSGYFTALLAQLAKEVISVEIVPELAAQASKRLLIHDIANTQVLIGDASQQWADMASFQVICLTGAVSHDPQIYLRHLQRGGRLLAVIGHAPAMSATLFTHGSNGVWQKEKLYETVITHLLDTTTKPHFEF